MQQSTKVTYWMGWLLNSNQISDNGITSQQYYSQWIEKSDVEIEKGFQIHLFKIPKHKTQLIEKIEKMLQEECKTK